MYAACVLSESCSIPHEFNSHTHTNYYSNSFYRNYPVVNVDWFQADQYCRWANGRLPTEAEWEKAARGEKGFIWPWGNDPPTDFHANIYTRNPRIDDTTEVGSFPDGASPYQVLDMAGNVFEWVADWYSSDYYKDSPYENPLGPSRSYRLDGGDPARVVRGGSWGWGMWESVSALHDWWEPSKYDTGVGFRCVIDSK